VRSSNQTSRSWLAAAVVFAVCGVLLFVGAAAAAKPSNTVRAVIWANTSVTIAPKVVTHGTVTLKVKNHANTPQALEINGVKTPLILPGGSIEMKLVLKKPGSYSIDLPDAQQTYQSEEQHYSTALKVK